MKFISTTRDRINSIPVEKGQVIFSSDDRVIYLDSTERTAYTTFIVLNTEEARKKLVPVSAFYFVEETAILWRYSNNLWTQLTMPPSEIIIFAKKEDFPEIGKENVIYMDGATAYIWSSEDGQYSLINAQK